MDVAAYVSHYIKKLRDDPENAYHRLLEVDDSAVPSLSGAFRSESDPETRRLLANVIWQHRVPSTVGFLAQLLEDRDPEVRQEAIDGLITLRSAEARRALEGALQRCRGDSKASVEFGEYLAEALELMESKPPGQSG